MAPKRTCWPLNYRASQDLRFNKTPELCRKMITFVQWCSLIIKAILFLIAADNRLLIQRRHSGNPIKIHSAVLQIIQGRHGQIIFLVSTAFPNVTPTQRVTWSDLRRRGQLATSAVDRHTGHLLNMNIIADAVINSIACTSPAHMHERTSIVYAHSLYRCSTKQSVGLYSLSSPTPKETLRQGLVRLPRREITLTSKRGKERLLSV